MDKLVGKTLNDRYIITEIVGVGGMAYVYKAFDKLVNRVVAVKILKEEFMTDAQFRRRFSNESKAITMLSQNNIVDVFDVCLEGDLMYIVMEYIDGITLKEYLDKVKVLEWHEAAFYIKQILKAMSHAHERGIVHRDLKPHNIMLLRDGTIKVTDFGIAKLSKFDTQTITDKAIGSVHYISPEQASGDRTDEKTDIYSVGVMFYEMITGSLPFVADNAVSVALMQVQAQPKLPREINPELPEGIEEITIKAMMKDPSLRYSKAAEMFSDIVEVEENSEKVFGYLDAEPVLSADENVVEDDSPTKFVDLNSIETSQLDNNDAVLIDEEEEETSKFKAVWLPIICGIASAITVIALVIVGIVYFPELKGTITNSNQVVEKVTVKNYIGQDYETVATENATGLVFQKVNVLSDEKEGIILSQDPAANTEVDKGSIIRFEVSIGVETVQVPDVSNQYYELALKDLHDLGILYKTKYISSDTVKESYVVKTDPEKYTEIKSDTTITVYISSGPEIVTVEVPDVIQRTESDAVEKLASNNLKADKIYEYNSDVPANCVISQNPVAGNKVEEGTSVEIVISLGPETVTPDTDNDPNNDQNTPNTDNEQSNTDDTTQEPDDNTNVDAPNDDNSNDEKPENPDDDTPSNDNTDDSENNDDSTDSEPTTVPYNFTLDLSKYSTSKSVTLSITTENGSWNENVTVDIPSISANNYNYQSATVTVPVGTVISVSVNGALITTYTA